MKTFEVFVSETANRQLDEMDAKTRERIKSTLRELKTNPFRARPKADIKKLVGSRNPELFRMRIGDFRAIYSIVNNKIMITEIFARNKGYKWLD